MRSPSSSRRLAPALLWAAVLVLPLAGAALLVLANLHREPAVVAATVLAALGLVPVWASAVQQLGLALGAAVRGREPDATAGGDRRRVAVVMCVADDFDARRARACADQDIPVELVVLDDSRTPAGRAAVDDFARAHPCRVVRRADRTGFKGGNLSHALESLADAPELWLVVDSDQALARHAARALRSRMAPGVAVVQGRPVPRPAETRFAALLGALPATHLAMSQRGRSAPWFLGRVALLDAEAVRRAGGVPGCVMEDVALTVELRRAGLRIVDAPEVAGEEDAPVDLRAFRVQQLKFLEGAVELVRRRGIRIARAPIPLTERLELLAGHLLVPAAVVGGAVALLAGTALASAGAFPVAAGVAGGIAAIAPFSAELVRLLRRGRPLSALAAAVLLPILYGSLAVAALGALVRLAAGGGARFRVTPKRAAGGGLGAVLRAHRAELAVAALGLLLAAVAPAFLLPLAAPAVTCLVVGMLGGLAPAGAAPRGSRRRARRGAQSAVAASSPSATRMRSASPARTSPAARTTRSPLRTTA